MLVELRIKNFAIIENLVIDFGGGFNVFTGETGAGKSIVIDAIALVLGERATGEVVRTGCSEAEVEALFDVSAVKGLDNLLSGAGIEPAEDLIVKRLVARAGRNRIYINGSLATLATLTEITRNLIDIYGQSGHQSLTRTDEHLDILDAFGGLMPLRAKMRVAYENYLSTLKERDSLLRGADASSARRDLLAYQSKEIEEAALAPGEDEELKGLRARLVNAEKIKASAMEAERVIYSDSGAVTERLGAVLRGLKEVAPFDEGIAGLIAPLESSLYQLEDAGALLRDRADIVEFDAARLEEIDERLFRIEELKKKYDCTLDGIAELKKKIDDELSGLCDLDERMAVLEEELASRETAAREVARSLTEKRGRAAEDLKARMEAELTTLGMGGALFEVIMRSEHAGSRPDTPRLSARGVERAAFYISANPGEEVKPLAKIASGGELSRIMLAIKTISSAGRVPTLIFDEIDTGIGGAMAHVVGAQLKALSEAHQVLCITHLPQIAASADNHFVVRKETIAVEGEGNVEGTRTVTTVRELHNEESLEQIAWMLGGENVTDTTREHALELMSLARRNVL